jgi:hypothetical protein
MFTGGIWAAQPNALNVTPVLLTGLTGGRAARFADPDGAMLVATAFHKDNIRSNLATLPLHFAEVTEEDSFDPVRIGSRPKAADRVSKAQAFIRSLSMRPTSTSSFQ